MMRMLYSALLNGVRLRHPRSKPSLHGTNYNACQIMKCTYLRLDKGHYGLIIGSLNLVCS